MRSKKKNEATAEIKVSGFLPAKGVFHNLLSSRRGILTLAIVFSILSWFTDALIDFLIFSVGSYSFLELLITAPPAHEIYIRLFIALCFISFGCILSVVVKGQSKVEEKLRESSENLRITLASIGDAVISTDLNGNVVRMNKVAVNLTHWNEQEARGKPLTEVFKIVNAFTRNPVENPVAKVLEKGKVVGLANHTILIAKNGKEYQIADSAAPILNSKNQITGVVLVFRDVTEAYEKNRKLEESEEFLKAVFHGIQDGISVLNKDLSIRYVNPVMEKWYAHNMPLVGKKCFECYHDSDKPCSPCPTLRSIKSGKTESEIVSGSPDPDSPIKWLELFSYPLTDSQTGEVTGVIEFVRDISRRKEAEETLRESEERFRLAFQTNPDAIAITRVADGTYVDVNEGFTRITGYTREEIISKSPSEIHIWHNMHDRNKLVSLLKKEGMVKNYEARFRVKSGDLIYGLMSASIIQMNGEKVILSISRDITEAKQAEKNLQTHKQRLELALKGANLGLWDWNIKTGEVIFNRRWSEMLGYKSEEIEPHFKSWEKLLHPDDVSLVMDALNAHFDGKTEYYHTEHRMRTSDGKWKWVYDSGKVLEWDKDGKPLRAVGTHLDIDERKIWEEALRRSEERLKAAQHIAGMGDIVWNIETGEVSWSDGIYDLLRYDKNEKINFATVNEKIHHPEDRNRITQWINESIESGSDEIPPNEYRLLRKDGEIIYVRAEGIIERINGAAKRMFVTLIEITEQKKYEAELKTKNEEYLATNEELSESLERIQEMNEQLRMAKQQAEESDRLKSAFLANMSHEIRTPMNGILGFTELLKTQNLNKSKQTEYIRIIQESGTRMLNLINDLIDISKIEAGQIKLMISEVNINEIIDYAKTFFSPEAEKKGITLTTDKAFKITNAVIETDWEKFIAVFTNLIKNAIKFTEKGNIHFGYKEKDGFLEFYVKDTGIGIPKERQKAVFERFVQADLSLTKPYEGAGLGLSISKSYINMLGGNIWLESEEGTGTTFYFTLPYRPMEAKPSITEDHIVSSENNHKLKNITVLIAEDDTAGKVFLYESLKNSCRRILHAETGTQALELYQNNTDIDVILMDIKMPGLNGYEVTKKIRESNQKIIIIAQTAYALAGDRNKALEAGCNDYLSKPVKKDDLLAVIHKHFKNLKK